MALNRHTLFVFSFVGLLLVSCGYQGSGLDVFTLPKNDNELQELTNKAHITIPEGDWQNLCRAPRVEIEAKITLIGHAQGWDQTTLDNIRVEEANRIRDAQEKYSKKPVIIASDLKTDLERGQAIRDLEAYDQFWASALFRYPEFSKAVPKKNNKVFGLLFNRAQCDEQNYVLASFKPILASSSFPTDAGFGKGTMRSIFLITQHADDDVDFQEKMLKDLKANPDVLPSRSLAMLTDRVKVNQGEPQIYGSQLECVDGAYRPKTVEDYEKLDARRASVGLDPIDEYLSGNPGCGNPF